MLETIQFFGYSGGVPIKNSATSSCIINADNSYILIDCAENAFINLIQANYKLSRVHSIFITHLHPDHVGGLIPFLFYKQVIRNFNKITFYGPKNLEVFVKKNIEFQGFKPGFSMEFIVISDGHKYEINQGLDIDILLLEHRLPCFAYRIYDGEKSLTYATDTRKFDKLNSFAQETELLILESTFPGGMEDKAYNKYHLSVNDALDIASAVNAKRLILTHYSPRFNSGDLKQIMYNGHSCFVGKRKIQIDK